MGKSKYKDLPFDCQADIDYALGYELDSINPKVSLIIPLLKARLETHAAKVQATINLIEYLSKGGKK